MSDYRFMKYDGLELKIYYDIEEGNKGDGYLTPIEDDYKVIHSIWAVNDETGHESDITGILSHKAITLFQEDLNQENNFYYER